MNRSNIPAILIALAAVVSSARAIAAQPAALSVTPDTLLWTWDFPPFTMRNMGADSLTIDSVDVGTCSHPSCSWLNPEYGFELRHGAEVHYGQIWHYLDIELYVWNGQQSFPELILAPGDSATLRVTNIDSCPICEARAADTWTPLYFWAGAEPDSLTRTLGFDYWVATEQQPQRTALLLHAAPNPFRDVATVMLDAPPGHVRVALFDALGRQMRILHNGPLGAGSHRFEIDAGGMSPGLLFVRAQAGTGSRARSATVPLVLVR